MSHEFGLVVVVPSRGRPDAVCELADAFEVTCTAGTRLVVAVDDDDPAIDHYVDHRYTRYSGRHTSMVHALNMAVPVALGAFPPPFAVGFVGDDHRPRSKGWDQAYLDALRELGTGMVYGDDLLQGERLPTQIAMTVDIVRALGYMAPPSLRHMQVDNFWRDLGRAAGCIRYLPDVVVEHMHPIAGKAEWSEGHRRVNQPAVYEADRIAYTRFRLDGSFQAAVNAVKALP